MMKLRRPSFPQNLDADLIIPVLHRNIDSVCPYPEIQFKESYVFCGSHERTAKGDDLSINVSSTSKKFSLRYNLKRDSIYHILPEYLFHPLDRYAGTDGDKEKFIEKRAAQKKIETEAKEYFHPFDRILNDIRIRFQNHLNDKVLDNDSFIIDFIIENGNVNKENPFIKACLPCLMFLRANRGTPGLITFALKTTFRSNLHAYDRRFMEHPVAIEPDSCHISLDGTVDDLFCGNEFMDWIELISVRCQTTVSSQDEIEMTANNIKEFESFFKHWFLNDSQMIEIEFGDYGKLPVVSDNMADGFLFLNYNTQLLVS